MFTITSCSHAGPSGCAVSPGVRSARMIARSQPSGAPSPISQASSAAAISPASASAIHASRGAAGVACGSAEGSVSFSS
jgi:hypothetical protein